MGQRVNRKITDLAEYQDLSHHDTALQLLPGALEIDVGFVEFDDLVITMESSNLPLTVQPRESDNLTRIFIPGSAGEQRRWNGALIPMGSAITSANWEGIFCNSPNEYDFEITLSECLASEIGLQNAQESFVFNLSSKEALTPWLLDLITHRKLTSTMHREVTSTLSKLLASSDTTASHTIEMHRRYALVKRVMVYLTQIRANQMYLSAKDLCDEIGTTQRTLQRAFNDVLAVSPYQYLMSVRLQSAYRWMQKKAHTTNVTEVGERFGFTSSSSFIGHYQSFFGETPAATLRRYKKQR